MTADPPILVGGRSKRALRRVAEKGEGWLGAFSSPDGYARGLEYLREEAQKVGRVGDEFVQAHCLHTVIDVDVHRAWMQAQQHFSARYGHRIEDHVIERYCLVVLPSQVGDG